jgi:hypothetical protein
MLGDYTAKVEVTVKAHRFVGLVVHMQWSKLLKKKFDFTRFYSALTKA